jgi:hypothetical protein
MDAAGIWPMVASALAAPTVRFSAAIAANAVSRVAVPAAVQVAAATWVVAVYAAAARAAMVILLARMIAQPAIRPTGAAAGIAILRAT